MREYLSLSNLRSALLLSVLTTVMSIPRIVQGGMDLSFYIPAALTSMTLVCGAATAWSHHAGMCGLFPGRRRTAIGVAVALGLALLFLPIMAWVGPVCREAMRASRNPELAALDYPGTVGGVLAVMLWSAGFETMFVRAGATSLFARLTRSQPFAIALALALRMAITSLRLTSVGVDEAWTVFFALTAVSNLVGIVLFARTGLIPAMTFAAGLNLHLLVCP